MALSPLLKLGRRLLTRNRAVGAALGAGAGYGMTPEGENPLYRAAIGGFTGGVAAPSLLYSMGKAKGLTDKFVQLNYWSLLGSLDTAMKAHLGGIGGTTAQALEKGVEAVLFNDPKAMVSAARTMKQLWSPDSAKLYYKVITGTSDEITKLHKAITGKKVGDISFRHMGGEKGLGRFFMAPDLVGIKAMRAGGLSASEAARYTLAGNPASALGKFSLDTFRKLQRGAKVPVTRGTSVSLGAPGKLLAAGAAPFPRVALTGLEKSLERIPVLGYGVHKLMKPSRLAREIAQPTFKEQTAQQIVGTTLGLGGATVLDTLDPRWKPLAATIGGPGYGAMWYGKNVSDRLRKGEPVFGAFVDSIGETFKELNPLGMRPLSLFYDAEREAAGRVIPSFLKDIAAGVDPAYDRLSSSSDLEAAYDRGEYPNYRAMPRFLRPLFESSVGPAIARQTWLGPYIARIPGLRETLPERFMPRGFFGDPVLPSAESIPGAEANPLTQFLSRSLAPSSRMAEPPPDLSDPQIKKLHELGINVGNVSASVAVPGAGTQYRQTPESAAAVMQLRGGVNKETVDRFLRIAGDNLLLTPDTPKRKLLAQQIWNDLRAEVQRGSTRARDVATMSGATLPGVLRP
jgi:hypothetical protein